LIKININETIPILILHGWTNYKIKVFINRSSIIVSFIGSVVNSSILFGKNVYDN